MNVYNLDFEEYLKIYNQAHAEMLKDLEKEKLQRKQKQFKTPEETFAECDKLFNKLNINLTKELK